MVIIIPAIISAITTNNHQGNASLCKVNPVVVGTIMDF